MIRGCFALLAATALSCGPVRPHDPEDGAIILGDEYYSAKERLLAAGAFEITNLAHFYDGKSPYSVRKSKDGTIIISSHLLVYTPHPSQQIRAWFILPDQTCVSLFARENNAGKLTSIELGEKARGFRPPEETLKPENLSPAIKDDDESTAVTIEHEEKAADPTLWSRQVRRSVDRLRLDDHSNPATQRTTIANGMQFPIAAGILAAHAADDISGGVAVVPMAEYVKGTYPRTLPITRLYVLPGNTLVILRGTYDPVAAQQFTVLELTVGEPGVGYPGGPRSWDQKFTEPESVDLRDLVRRAGPLHFAAQTGDLDAIRSLLREDSALINSRDQEQSTPLHLAVKRGRREAARLLIRSGADVQATDPNGDTPLILAAWQGRPDLVSLLLQNGARAKVVNNRGDSPFLAAGRRGDVATVSLLLDQHQVDVNQTDASAFTLLHRAALDSDASMARVLLKHGPNLNPLRGGDNITPLFDAINSGAVEVTQLLLEAGARVQPASEKEYRPLDAAAGNGSVEIARMLFARGVKPDGPALFQAVSGGHGPMVKLFLEHGANPRYTAEHSTRTLLHSAHSAAVVRLLVDAGLDIESRNEDDETPLHDAAQFGPHEVVVALLELGADPRAVNKQKQTPLQLAEERDESRGGKEQILRTLRAAMKKK